MKRTIIAGCDQGCLQKWLVLLFSNNIAICDTLLKGAIRIFPKHHVTQAHIPWIGRLSYCHQAQRLGKHSHKRCNVAFVLSWAFPAADVRPEGAPAPAIPQPLTQQRARWYIKPSTHSAPATPGYHGNRADRVCSTARQPACAHPEPSGTCRRFTLRQHPLENDTHSPAVAATAASEGAAQGSGGKLPARLPLLQRSAAAAAALARIGGSCCRPRTAEVLGRRRKLMKLQQQLWKAGLKHLMQRVQLSCRQRSCRTAPCTGYSELWSVASQPSSLKISSELSCCLPVSLNYPTSSFFLPASSWPLQPTSTIAPMLLSWYADLPHEGVHGVKTYLEEVHRRSKLRRFQS